MSKLRSTRTSVLTAIQDKLRELEHWHAQHTVALETARGQHLTAISKEVDQPLDLGRYTDLRLASLMYAEIVGSVFCACYLLPVWSARSVVVIVVLMPKYSCPS